jgi:tetratricopeptide (TPR) repeat protein
MAPANHPLTRKLTTLAAAVLLGGCALPPPYHAESPAPTPTPVVAPPQPAPLPSPPAAAAPAKTVTAPPPKEAPAPASREFHLGAAAQSLVAQARAQSARGEFPGASGTLDRAIRIEPQNPLLWIEVARLRLTEGDFRQAETCARRALMLGSADDTVRTTAGHLLADVLRAQHRDAEAKDLESQPWMN